MSGFFAGRCRHRGVALIGSHAGGIPAVMKSIETLLHTDALTVSGKTVADNLPSGISTAAEVIATIDAPFQPPQGLAVVRGNLAPTK